MNTSLISRFFAAVGACVGLAQAAVAQDSIAAEPVSVWIFSDRYISAEHEFSDLEPLDARIQPTRPRVVRLDLCEPFAARLLSMAYQFRDFHLEIRPLVAEHSACMDQAVDRYWLSVMP